MLLLFALTIIVIDMSDLPPEAFEGDPLKPERPLLVDGLLISEVMGSGLGILKRLSNVYAQIPKEVQNFDDVSSFTRSLYDNSRKAQQLADALLLSGNPDEDSIENIKTNFFDNLVGVPVDGSVVVFSETSIEVDMTIQSGTQYMLSLRLRWEDDAWVLDFIGIQFLLGDQVCKLSLFENNNQLIIYFNNVNAGLFWEGLILKFVEGSSEFHLLERKVHNYVLVDGSEYKVVEMIDLQKDFERIIEYYDFNGNIAHTVTISEEGDYLYAESSSTEFLIEETENAFGIMENAIVQLAHAYSSYLDPEQIEIATLPTTMANEGIEFYKAKVVRAIENDTVGTLLESSAEGVTTTPVESLSVYFDKGTIYELCINGVSFYQDEFNIHRSPEPGVFIVWAEKKDILPGEQPVSYLFRFTILPSGQIANVLKQEPVFEVIDTGSMISRLVSLN